MAAILLSKSTPFRLLLIAYLLALLAALASALDRANDPGHGSDTYHGPGCVACKTAAWSAEVGGLAICAATACFAVGWFTFGIPCAICIATVGAAFPAALLGCEHSGWCCPQTCDRGNILSPGGCCFGDETCLNHDGLCCAANQQACVGRACCNPDQSCISVGMHKGTCCPDTATICNNFCCPEDDDVICIGAKRDVCCPSNYACDNACCYVQQPSLFGQAYCADKGASLCCYTYEVLVDGICCPKGSVNCGGVCCSGSCMAGQCVMTSDQCLKVRGNGETCEGTGWSTCHGFAACHNGCCVDVPK